MSPLAVEIHPQAHSIKCTDVAIIVELVDGRIISASLVWFPSLAQASKEQRENWELLGEGEGVHWPEVDEDLSIAGLLASAH